MPRARIAIPIPTSSNPEYNNRSWPTYAAAIEAAGGEPVRIDPSTTTRELRDQARSCSGILLPGSPADVDPARFGAERDPATSPADPAREAADFALLDHAERTRKPVLAICYGCQSLNVWRGGALVQDLAPLPVNHSAGRAVAIAHTALIARDSLLGALTDPTEAPIVPDSTFLRLPVNTSHHQAVAAPGEGLRIVARSPEDGVIEAIEAHRDRTHPMLLGVQWHPERSTEISATSRNLFAHLIEQARAPR
jgi:putative glutamine amidotransferase